MKSIIESKSTCDLIIESVKKGYKKVKVEFVPAYNKDIHGFMNNKKEYKKLLSSLKSSKISIFNIPDECFDIIYLVKNNKDIKSIYFI